MDDLRKSPLKNGNRITFTSKVKVEEDNCSEKTEFIDNLTPESSIEAEEDYNESMPLTPPDTPKKGAQKRKWYNNKKREGDPINGKIFHHDDLVKPPKYKSWAFAPKNMMMRSTDSFSNLNYLPYLDDTTFEKESKLVDEMSAEYTSQDAQFEQYFLRNKKLVFELLDKLKSGSVEPCSTIISAKRLEKTRALDLVELKELEELRVRPEAVKQKLLPDCPTDDMFKAACIMQNLDVKSWSKLKEKYIQHLLQATPKKYENSPNLDSLTNDSKIPQNREAIMGSFKRLFCRKCFIYNCPLHVELPTVTDFIKKRGPAVGIETCNSLETSTELADTMTDADKCIIKAIAPIFPNNSCAVAEILMKDCASVATFVQKEHIFEGPDVVYVQLLTDTKVNGDNDNEPKAGPSNGPEERIKKSRMVKQPPNPKHPICQSIHYEQCTHPGTPCTAINNCACKINRTYCEKFCTCDEDCSNKFKGCRCEDSCSSSGENACPCVVALRECDPDVCRQCGACEFDEKKIHCKNISIQRGWHHHLLWAKSTVDGIGWGIFAKNLINKHDFVYEYTGELISAAEADRRSMVYDNVYHTFLFSLNSDYTVDATRYGSKIKFANHSNTPNCEARHMMVNGDHRIGVYANCDIKAGEEIFLSYGNVLRKHAFIKEKREKRRCTGKK